MKWQQRGWERERESEIKNWKNTESCFLSLMFSFVGEEKQVEVICSRTMNNEDGIQITIIENNNKNFKKKKKNQADLIIM